MDTTVGMYSIRKVKGVINTQETYGGRRFINNGAPLIDERRGEEGTHTHAAHTDLRSFAVGVRRSKSE